jgi:hypothetical protein
MWSCWGRYPRYRRPPVTAQNSWYDRFPPAANGWRTIHPVSGNGPTTPSWRGGATNLKRTNPGNDPWPSLLHPMISMGRRDFATYLPFLPLSLTQGKDPSPWSSVPRGFPQTDKHCPLWASGRSGLRHLAWRDIATGTHTHLTVCNGVWNPSHRCLTALPRRRWSWCNVDAESCWRQCYRVMLAMVLPSLAGNGAAEVMLVVVWCRYRVMLVTVLSSHTSDGAAEATWPRRNVDVESWWRWRYRGDLTVAWCRCRVMLTTILPSHAGDGGAEATWSQYDVDVEPCWRQCCRLVLVMALPMWLGRGAM